MSNTDSRTHRYTIEITIVQERTVEATSISAAEQAIMRYLKKNYIIKDESEVELETVAIDGHRSVGIDNDE
jgi:ribosomal protein L16/L10AE